MKISAARLMLLAAAAVLVPACGGAGSGSSSGKVSFAPGPGFVPGGGGTKTIRTNGGTGTATAGGGAGVIFIENFGGGDASILKTGSINADFTMPTTPINLGPNPRRIMANTVYTIGAPSTTTVTQNAITILGDDGVNVATGLFVAPGVTLTLPAHYDFQPDLLNDWIWLEFSHGLRIEGTVLAGRVDQAVQGDGASLTAAQMYLYGENVSVASGALLDSSGTPGGATGGNGGGVFLRGTSAAANAGTLQSLGGNGDVGGMAGWCSVVSWQGPAFNSGTMIASGGAGVAGAGGIGGIVEIGGGVLGGALGGGAYNSGPLTAKGGDGTAGGGSGGFILMSFWFFGNPGIGPVFTSGTLDCSGGNALTAGIGGQSGFMQLISHGGQLRVAGSLINRGGNGVGANGGLSQGIVLEAQTTAAQPVTDGAFIGADLDTRGGDGAQGGLGGSVQIRCRSDIPVGTVRPGAVPLLLAGYLSFNTSGGLGATDGGTGGAVQARNFPVVSPGGNPYTGSFLNEVDITTTGGLGTSGGGGIGGGVALGAVVQIPNSVAANFSRTNTNAGIIDSRGGVGATTGGAGGAFLLVDQYHVRNQASVTTSGGRGGSGTGGTGGQIRIGSDGVSINAAALTSDGGETTGAGNGGLAGQVFVEGASAESTGAISARGGNSAAGTGGNGRAIEIGSWNGQTLSLISGTLGVQAGTGATPGAVGIVTIDGVRVALTNGSVSF